MVMVAHTFNLCTGKTRQADLCQFETSLVYRWSSRMAKAIYYTEKPCQEKRKPNKLKKFPTATEYPLLEQQQDTCVSKNK